MRDQALTRELGAEVVSRERANRSDLSDQRTKLAASLTQIEGHLKKAPRA